MSKRVIIQIVGGVAEVINKPEGVAVEIRDYDVNDNEHLWTRDHLGTPYVEKLWQTEEKVTL